MLSLIAALALSATPCTPLPGMEPVLADPARRIVMLGETHGTTELPSAFADAVCAAAGQGPVVVALEWLPENQAHLDAWLASDGSPAAREALMTAPAWSDRIGRASGAMLRLLEDVRRMRAAGMPVSLLAFDAPATPPAPTDLAREQGMAALVLKAADAQPDARVLVLTGAGHADRTAFTSFGAEVPSMIRHLPAGRVLSLAWIRPGGQVWGCRAPEGGGAAVCGVYDAPVRDEARPRGAGLGAPRPGFDGWFSGGASITASAPAKP